MSKISSVLKKWSEFELYKSSVSDEKKPEIFIDYSHLPFWEDANFTLEYAFADEKVSHPFKVREEDEKVYFFSLPLNFDVGYLPSNNFTGLVGSPTRECAWAKYSVYADNPHEVTRLDGILEILEHGKYDSEIIEMLNRNLPVTVDSPSEVLKDKVGQSFGTPMDRKIFTFFRSANNPLKK